MAVDFKSWLAELGFLRIALLLLAIINMLIPLIGAQLIPVTAGDRSLWSVLAIYITPVLAPLIIVVILFDYLMSRMRAADAVGEQRRRFIKIGRAELAVIGITLLFWVPFFVSLMT